MQSVSAEYTSNNNSVTRDKDKVDETEESQYGDYEDSTVDEEEIAEEEVLTPQRQPQSQSTSGNSYGSTGSSDDASGTNSSSGVLTPQPATPTKKPTTANTESTAGKDEEETNKKHGSITIQEMGYSFEGPDNPSGVTIKKFNVGVFANR